MSDGSTMIVDLYAIDLQYSPPTTDYLIFDWNEISSTNPTYVPNPTDYLVFDFTPKQGPQAIGLVSVYDGSALNANNTVTDLGTVVLYEGSECDTVFTTTVIAYFQPTLYEGSSAASSLATTVVLTGDGDWVASDGATNVFTFTTHPAGTISTANIVAYDGSYLTTPLGTTLQFSTVFSDGSTEGWGTSDLVTCPGCNSIIIDFYDGAEMDVDVAAFEDFALVIYDGSECDVTLSTFPFWSVPQTTFYDGAECDSSLSTTVVLTADGDLVNPDGAECDVTFTTNPPWNPSFVFYDGAVNTFALSTQYQLEPWIYDGAECDVTFTTNPQWSPSFVFYDGAEYDQATIAAQQSLPVLIAYEGTEFDIGTVSNLENWYFYEGSQFLSNLATQVDLTADGALVNPTGDWLSLALTTHPSQPFGSLNIFTGESLTETVSAYPHASLSCIFWQDMYLQADFSTSTHHIDLARQCAVNQPDSYFYWQNPEISWLNLTNGGVQAIPGALATGFNTYMNVTIAFRERLNPEPMYHGETFGIYDFWPLLASSGEMGFGMTVLDLKFDLDIPLCYGNFIPDGNAVNAELSQLDDTSCTVDQAYDGTCMSVFMENNVEEKTTWYVGEQTYSNLTTVPAMFVQFWSGEQMFVASNAELQTTMYEGEFLTVAFAPMQVQWYDGATMTVPTIQTDYTVQFMEVGCLQNEYVDEDASQITNPFGAPPTANIELKPYYHQIQAECF